MKMHRFSTYIHIASQPVVGKTGEQMLNGMALSCPLLVCTYTNLLCSQM